MRYAEKKLRAEVCEIGKRLYARGLVSAADGNISAMLDDGEFISTPSGVSKGFLTPEMLCKVDINSQALAENKFGYKPSSEFKLHAAVYLKRSDVGAVVHAHPTYSSLFAVCRTAIDMQILSEATISFGDVPVAEYFPPSTSKLSHSIDPFIDDHDAILLANHGALTVGGDLISAYNKMESLESYAQLVYLLKGVESPKTFTDIEIMELLEIRKNHYKLPGRHPNIKLLSRDKKL